MIGKKQGMNEKMKKKLQKKGPLFKLYYIYALKFVI